MFHTATTKGKLSDEIKVLTRKVLMIALMGKSMEINFLTGTGFDDDLCNWWRFVALKCNGGSPSVQTKVGGLA